MKQPTALSYLTQFRVALIIFLELIVSTIGLAGCASVPMASNEQDNQAKTFAVKPGTAVIFVYRKKQLLGFVGTTQVELDGTVVGRTAMSTYLMLQVSPGQHVLVSSPSNQNPSLLEVNAKEGNTYFVWQELNSCKTMCSEPSSQLHLVDQETGKAEVTDGRLIDDAAARDLGGKNFKIVDHADRLAPTGVADGDAVAVIISTLKRCDSVNRKNCEQPQNSTFNQLEIETCIESGIANRLPNINIVQAEVFLKAAFPGKDAIAAALDNASILTFLGDNELRTRIARFKVRYLVDVNILTVDEPSTTDSGFLGVGVTFGRPFRRNSTMGATILDVRSRYQAGVVTSSVSENGGWGIVVPLILFPLPIPAWHMPNTESKGCAELGLKVADFIAGKDRVDNAPDPEGGKKQN